METTVTRKPDQCVRCSAKKFSSFKDTIATRKGKLPYEVQHELNFIEPDDATVNGLYLNKTCTSNTPPTKVCSCVSVCKCAYITLKQTRDPIRQALVNETMRKFHSALINISHYLKSEKTQLNSQEVSVITANLKEILTGFNSNVSIDSAKMKKQPDVVRSRPPRFKDTATSKFRRMHNTLKKQRLIEKEDERLKWPEWNFGSSHNFRRPRSRESGAPTRAKSLNGGSKYTLKQRRGNFGNITQNRQFSGALEPDFSSQTNSDCPKNFECVVSGPNISDKQGYMCVFNETADYPRLTWSQSLTNVQEAIKDTLNLYPRKVPHIVSNFHQTVLKKVASSAEKFSQVQGQGTSARPWLKNCPEDSSSSPKKSDEQGCICFLNETTADYPKSLTSKNIQDPSQKNVKSLDSVAPHRVSNFHQTVWKKVARSAGKFSQVQRPGTGARSRLKNYPERSTSAPVPGFLPERLSEMSVADLPELFPVTCQLLNENVSLSATRQLSTDRSIEGKVDCGDFLEFDCLSNDTSSSAESETERSRKKSTFSPRLVKSSSFPPLCLPLSYGKQGDMSITYGKNIRISQSTEESGSTTGIPESPCTVLGMEAKEVISQESVFDQDEDNWSTASASGYETSWDSIFCE